MDDEKFYIEALNLFVGIGKNAETAIEDWSNIIDLVANFKKKFDSEINLSIIILYYFIEVKKEIVHPFILDYLTYSNLKNSVIHDHLTKVYNRNFFEKIIKLEVDRAHRYKKYLTMVLIDIDNFKMINEKKGHLAGDKVLKEVAQIIQDYIRTADFLFRYRSDEFILLVPETDINGTLILIKRLQNMIKKRLKVTVSCGMSSYKMDSFSIREMLEHADIALYQAKKDGKGKIKTYLKERRRYFRLPYTFEFLYRLKGTKDFIFTEGINFSETGILFLSDTPIGVDMSMEFSFRFPNEEKRINGIGKVTRIEKIAENMFEMGIDFIKITDAEVKSIKKVIEKYILNGED
jgi:diguanylate cyclase (GGDEF)-like protein